MHIAASANLLGPQKLQPHAKRLERILDASVVRLGNIKCDAFLLVVPDAARGLLLLDGLAGRKSCCVARHSPSSLPLLPRSFLAPACLLSRVE